MDTPDHRLSSGRLLECEDADSTRQAIQPNMGAFFEFRFRESGQAGSDKHRHDEVTGLPPLPLLAIESSGHRPIE
jgi:hypothetical protein